MHLISKLPYVSNVPSHYRFDQIFDCGANTGQSLKKFAEEFPTAQIHSFEPVPSTFALLQETARGLDGDRFHCHCFALSDKSGTATMYQKELNTQNTLTPDINVEGTEGVEIEMVRIRDIFAKLRIGHIDILKLDLEGFEIPALRGAAGILAERVSFIGTECNFTIGDHRQTTYSDLEAFLGPFGFTPFGIYDVNYRARDGRLDYCDALFVNRAAIQRRANEILREKKAAEDAAAQAARAAATPEGPAPTA